MVQFASPTFELRQINHPPIDFRLTSSSCQVASRLRRRRRILRSACTRNEATALALMRKLLKKSPFARSELPRTAISASSACMSHGFSAANAAKKNGVRTPCLRNLRAVSRVCVPDKNG